MSEVEVVFEDGGLREKPKQRPVVQVKARVPTYEQRIAEWKPIRKLSDGRLGAVIPKVGLVIFGTDNERYIGRELQYAEMYPEDYAAHFPDAVAKVKEGGLEERVSEEQMELNKITGSLAENVKREERAYLELRKTADDGNSAGTDNLSGKNNELEDSELLDALYPKRAVLHDENNSLEFEEIDTCSEGKGSTLPVIAREDGGAQLKTSICNRHWFKGYEPREGEKYCATCGEHFDELDLEALQEGWDLLRPSFDAQTGERVDLAGKLEKLAAGTKSVGSVVMSDAGNAAKTVGRYLGKTGLLAAKIPMYAALGNLPSKWQKKIEETVGNKYYDSRMASMFTILSNTASYVIAFNHLSHSED